MQIEMVGFKELSTLYPNDIEFCEAWKTCTKPITLNKSKWLYFMIQDSMLFKGSQLHIPVSSMIEYIIKEMHSGGLAGHFGRDKTIAPDSEKLLLATVAIRC